jgi:hypothetical protein
MHLVSTEHRFFSAIFFIVLVTSEKRAISGEIQTKKGPWDILSLRRPVVYKSWKTN